MLDITDEDVLDLIQEHDLIIAETPAEIEYVYDMMNRGLVSIIRAAGVTMVGKVPS
jgi:hypothetical protein